MKRFVETWKINNVINLALLENIDEEYLAELSAWNKGKLVDLFAHMVQVRMLWLRENDPEIVIGGEQLNSQNFHKRELMAALSQSGDAIAKMIERTLQNGRIKGFKTPLEFLNYIVSYESQSRNKIVLMLGFAN